ncbi:MAG: addiction module protein [Candidatus Scalindua sp.]|nr:addiction module protein [Candidatus Scalindua sp.]MCR4343655.1 addiction module protein [Candidatus Scalindua sp.]
MPTLPLEEMTVSEKLQVMEELWSDLCCNQDQIPVPQWHKDILDRREELVKQGKATFVDWKTAKKRIANRIS